MAPNSKIEIFPIPPSTSSSAIITRSKFREGHRDKKEKKEILVGNYFYDVTDWVKRHPGGRIIDFYTEPGEDATIAVQQFHARSSKKVAGILRGLKRRPASDAEIDLDPATLKRHRALTKDFTELHWQLEAEGLFKPSVCHVVYRLLELVILETIGLLLVHTKQSLGLNLLGVVFMSIYHARCGFLVHESGHRALTGHAKLDRVIEVIVFGFGDGMSASWWTSHHSRHHAMPQRMERDVDLETMPLMAFNAKVVRDEKQGKRFFVQNQIFFFLALDTLLVMFFWKFYLHPRCALVKKNVWELLAMTSHYIFIYYCVGFWPFMGCMWLGSVYMLGTFSLSHTHLPVTSDRLHWVEYGFLHTMDIEPSWWCDWWMGWLNYQIEHHLFPAIPHFRLYGIRQRIQNMAAKHGIPYQCLSYDRAVLKTAQNLIQVSKQLGKVTQ